MDIGRQRKLTEGRVIRARALTSVLYLFLAFTNLLIAGEEGTMTGRLSGRIVDGETGEGLIGANVFLDETTIGAATDLDGVYLIKQVPPGNYDLVVSMIGYARKLIRGVRVLPGEVLKLDLSVAPEILETEDVVVTAAMLTNSEGAMLRQRQKSVAVTDAISAEAISRSGSSDAAAAMKKVTGASVVGGKYVYIRGLGERYSSTMLNGSELPSADPDKRSFQMDLFPAGLLENIVTLKTFTPDKPGTFSGGLVDVTTKSFPDQFFLQVSSSGSYNSQATGNSRFMLPNGGGSDFLGIDDGTRELSSLLSDPNVQIPRIQDVQTREQALFLDRVMNGFSRTMAPLSASAPVNQGLSITTGNRLGLAGGTLGYIGSLSWGQSYSFYDNGTVGRYFLSGPLDEVDGLNANRLLNDSKGTREANWGSMVRLAYENHFGRVTGTYLHTQSAESTARSLNGFWIDLPQNSDTQQNFFETQVLSWVERSLDSFQLEGKHQLPWLFKSSLEWRSSYATNSQDEPDQRFFSNTLRVVSRPDQPTRFLYDTPPSLLPPPIRYFRDLNESSGSGGFDLGFPFRQWGGHSSKLKAGFYYANTERDYSQRRFDVQLGVPYRDFAPDINSFFEVVGIIDSSAADPADWRFGHSVIENITPKNNFSGTQDTYAGYFMLELPLSRKLRFVGGARLESTEMTGVSGDTTLARGRLDDSDWLPSLNFIYSMTDNMNLRIAYTNTIARPTFRELAPYRNFEFITDFVVEGNPNLERTLIRNYDMRWEWFVNPGELLAVSGFYKDFDNPIERFQDAGVPNGLMSVQNVQSARILGVELELRKNLGMFGSLLDNFSLGSNLSLVHSEVDIPEEELFTIRASDPDAAGKRDFQGQSPYIFNLDFSYGNPKISLNAGLFYNIFGDRLSIITEGASPDVFERGYGSLDFKFSKGLFQNFKVSFAARNILNPDIKFSQELSGREFLYTQYRRGVSYSFSLGADL